ncbi:MAG: hypothetical protein ACOYIE_04030 [Agathobaculum sp.]|jgi:hypothetical protein|uniref:hypothetical protein n=1 Tax=Agathobaculum sp. TaxID=2048138 RepID=UPI003D902A5A
MDRQNREALAAVIAAVCLLAAAAFEPAGARSAWWCTSFSVVCSEAMEQQNAPQVEFRCRLAGLWRALRG